VFFLFFDEIFAKNSLNGGHFNCISRSKETLLAIVLSRNKEVAFSGLPPPLHYHLQQDELELCSKLL